MIITTTPTVEGKQISSYLGIVSSCVLASIGATKKGVDRGWHTGMDEAMAQLLEYATQMKADAIVGFKADAYHSSGMADYLYLTGTAVKLS